MTRPWLMAACLALCPALSRFANAAAYVGAGACRPCHAAIFESQSASPHAAALSPVSDIQKSMVTGITIQRKPSYQVQILNSGGDLRVHITDGTDLMDLPLEWA